MAALLYEPVLGGLVGGFRRAGLALYPPREGMRILDVGCGTGAHLALYAAAGCRVAGVDASDAMLREARRRLGPDALLARADAAALPFAGGAFDLVVATTLLHALALRVRAPAVAEMARVAGGGGRLLLIDYRLCSPRRLRDRLARSVAFAVEGAAGHLPGVRSLLESGGVRALAARAGLAVIAEATGAGGAMGMTLLGRARENGGR